MSKQRTENDRRQYPKKLKRFEGWEEAFETEAEAIEWYERKAADRPTKRPAAFTKVRKSGLGWSTIRQRPNLKPVFEYNEAHPVDSVWNWYGG